MHEPIDSEWVSTYLVGREGCMGEKSSGQECQKESASETRKTFPKSASFFYPLEKIHANISRIGKMLINRNWTIFNLQIREWETVHKNLWLCLSIIFQTAEEKSSKSHRKKEKVKKAKEVVSRQEEKDSDSLKKTEE